jgi:HAD superfamily hydrolase (TIGR01509 family)
LATELVIFDCDGVLVDSETISARVLLSRLAACGVNVDFEHFRTHFLGRSFPKVAAEVREKHRVALPEDFEASYRSDLLAAFDRELKPMPDILAVVDRLSVSYCVATSSSPPRARRSLEITGLLDRFEGRIFTASEVTNGKPAPDLFLHAARTMGADPVRCLVIEDSLPGLHAGLAAGMQVWQFTGGSHLRGEDAGLPGVRLLNRWSAFPEMMPQLFGAGQGLEGVLK